MNNFIVVTITQVIEQTIHANVPMKTMISYSQQEAFKTDSFFKAHSAAKEIADYARTHRIANE